MIMATLQGEQEQFISETTTKPLALKNTYLTVAHVFVLSNFLINIRNVR
jgi:hypothetical protein